MRAHDAVNEVCRALDPVLEAAGFLPGQGGWDDGGGAQVVFCIGHDDLSGRYPLLPQAGRQPGPRTCVDLVVDVLADGTLERADLEGVSLEDTVRVCGSTADAEAVARLVGRAVADVLPTLATALGRLFPAARA